MANPGMPLISIETPGNFEVMAMVPESEISQIKSGTTVDVLVKSIKQNRKRKSYRSKYFCKKYRRTIFSKNRFR